MKNHKVSPTETRVHLDPEEIARLAGLIYVNDQKPGFQRRRRGKKFQFIDLNGKTIKDPKEIQRINSLAIPPAYEEVWICSKKNGHLQATGRDAKGRKQYRYHNLWREVSDQTKYHKMLAFAQTLPRIREQIDIDLALKGMPKEKILAALVQLLQLTLIRVGNEVYVKENKSFGLTTLRNRHVAVQGTKITFKFRGKSKQDHNISISHRRLAKIIQTCKELPGQDLFEYLDDSGQTTPITSTDVNNYLRSITNDNFTAKDFRTWAGTVAAVFALHEFPSYTTETEARKNIVQAVQKVSKILGNTPAVCRKSYIHPEVLHTYLDGSLRDTIENCIKKKPPKSIEALTQEEQAVFSFLKARLIEKID